MTAFTRARCVTLAALLGGPALSGCTLFDAGKGEVRLEPPGPIRTRGPFTVRVAKAAGRDKSRLFLDGKELGTFETGSDVSLDLSSEGEGGHQLVARAYDGDRTTDSRAVEVIIDRTPPRATVSPASGDVATEGALVIQVDFDELMAADTAALDRIQMRSGTGASLPFTASFDPGARRLVVTSGARFLDVAPVAVGVQARDAAGNTVQTGGFYTAPRLSDVRVSFDRPIPLAGVVQITVSSWLPRLAARLTVEVDGVVLGDVSAGGTLTWDTRTSPATTHRLTFRAPGHLPFSAGVTTDNTPPSLVSCAAHGTAFDDGALISGVDIVFTEGVCSEVFGPAGSCDQRLPSWPASLRASPPFPRPPLPFTWQPDLTLFHDRAGLPVTATPSCSVPFPAWRKPWGATLLLDGAVPLAGEVVLEYKANADGGEPDSGGLVGIAPAGAAVPGAVVRLASVPPAAWLAVGPALNGDLASLASQLRHRGVTTWIETDGSGTTAIRARWPLFPGLVTAATVPAAGGLVVLVEPGFAIGWLETGAAGNRELHVARPPSDTSAGLLAPAHADPASDASEASVDEGIDLYAAFVEQAAGAVPVLRVRQLPAGATAWVSRGDVLNRDPAVPASAPSIGYGLGSMDGPFVAWVEGGKVLARVGAPGGFGPAQVLNADPAVAARAPRVLGRRVVFVERSGGADVFEVREWDETARSWVALPSLPTGGEVAAWSGSPIPLAILWRDPAGEYRLRAFNE